LFHDRVLREAHFALDKGACLLQKASRREFFEAYEAAVPSWRRRLREDCRALVRRIRSAQKIEDIVPAGDEPEGEE
jgi:CRISPR-associated protein Cas1